MVCLIVLSSKWRRTFGKSRDYCLEISQVSPDIMLHTIQILLTSRRTEVDQFTILSTLLEIQVYYFMPTPGFSPEIFRRNALRCHTTAQLVVRLALKLQGDMGFLSHAPHFVCRSMLTAACILISAMLSPSLRAATEGHIREAGGTPDGVVNDALAGVRHCSVQEGDLPVRAAKMMESAWHVRGWLPPTEISQGDFVHRMGMGLPLDCIRRWKLQMEMMRPERTTPVPGAGVDLQAGAGAGGGANGGGASAADNGGVGADLLAGDPFSRVDWDAFMQDFDWNFDPNLMDSVVVG